MTAMRVIGLFLLCLLLSGCVGTMTYGYPISPTKVLIEPNPHQGLTPITSPATEYALVPLQRYTLISWIGPRENPKSGTFYVQVQAHFTRRAYLHSVYSGGRELDTDFVDYERMKCKCTYPAAETIQINLTESEMAELAIRGITFEVVGRRERFVMTIPAAYFENHLTLHRGRRDRVS